MPTFQDPSPFHRVVVYYQTQYYDTGSKDQNGNSIKKYLSPSPLTPVATHVIIAAFHLFADSNDSNTKKIHLNNNDPDDPSFDQMWVDVARMQGSGVKIMGMLGGAAAGSYGNLSSDFKDYYSLLSSVITKHRLDGIDLDIEEGDSLSSIEQIIKQLKADFGPDFIVTLAPVAYAMKGNTDPFSGIKYSDLETAFGYLIDWYNVQFYSGFGTMSTTQDYIDIVTDCPLDPCKLVAGTLTSSSSGSGYVDLDTVKSTMRQLLRLYGSRFGGIAAWEYYNSDPDTSEPWSWAALMKVTMMNWKDVLSAE